MYMNLLFATYGLISSLTGRYTVRRLCDPALSFRVESDGEANQVNPMIRYTKRFVAEGILFDRNTESGTTH